MILWLPLRLKFVPNQQKSRRAWSGSSMILWLVMLARKRFRLGKSDDLDYLFRIGWVTRQSQSKRRKKHRTSRGDMETRRRQRGKTGRNPPYRHQSPPTAFSASPREQNSGWSPVLGRKRFRLAKSDDQDSFNSEANFGEQSLENRRPRHKIVSPVPSFFMLFYLDRLVIFLILG